MRNGSLARLQRRPEAWLLAVIIVAGAVLSVAAPGFLTLANLVDLLETYSVQSIMAMGLFVVLVSGGIDISFAATASVAQYIAVILATQAGMPGIVAARPLQIAGIFRRAQFPPRLDPQQRVRRFDLLAHQVTRAFIRRQIIVLTMVRRGGDAQLL